MTSRKIPEDLSRVINELSVVPTKNFKDEKIAKRIVDNLERNIYTDASTVTVKVDKGHVTLSGTLPIFGQKISAYEVIRYVEGVRRNDYECKGRIHKKAGSRS